jgi:ankyrin repeat protein
MALAAIPFIPSVAELRKDPARYINLHRYYDDVFSRRLTILHVAVAVRSLPLVKCVLEHAAYYQGSALLVNTKLGNGVTALHLAVHQNCLSMVRLLVLQKGIDLSVKDMFGKTALQVAIERDAVKCLNVLWQANTALMPEDALHLAITNGATSVAGYVLKKHRWDCNALDRHGYTPLHSAVMYEKPKCVHLLLQQPTIDTQRWSTDVLQGGYSTPLGASYRIMQALQKYSHVKDVRNKVAFQLLSAHAHLTLPVIPSPWRRALHVYDNSCCRTRIFVLLLCAQRWHPRLPLELWLEIFSFFNFTEC